MPTGSQRGEAAPPLGPERFLSLEDWPGHLHDVLEDWPGHLAPTPRRAPQGHINHRNTDCNTGKSKRRGLFSPCDGHTAATYQGLPARRRSCCLPSTSPYTGGGRGCSGLWDSEPPEVAEGPGVKRGLRWGPVSAPGLLTVSTAQALLPWGCLGPTLTATPPGVWTTLFVS